MAAPVGRGPAARECRRRQEQSDHTAEDRQQEALDQELAREPGPARAQRGAHRELVHATGRPDEREVGHVHAGYEQDEPTAANTRCSGPRALDTSSSCSGVATIALFFAAGQRSRIGRRQRRQFGLRLFERDAVAQPADGRQRVVLFVGVPGEA